MVAKDVAVPLAAVAAGAGGGLLISAGMFYLWLCFGLDCSWLVEDE